MSKAIYDLRIKRNTYTRQVFVPTPHDETVQAIRNLIRADVTGLTQDDCDNKPTSFTRVADKALQAIKAKLSSIKERAGNRAVSTRRHRPSGGFSSDRAVSVHDSGGQAILWRPKFPAPSAPRASREKSYSAILPTEAMLTLGSDAKARSKFFSAWAATPSKHPTACKWASALPLFRASAKSPRPTSTGLGGSWASIRWTMQRFQLLTSRKKIH